jgi:hypothetical protein
MIDVQMVELYKKNIAYVFSIIYFYIVDLWMLLI